jgi:hypothetical protein
MISHQLTQRPAGQPALVRAPAARAMPARRSGTGTGAGGGRAAGVLTLQRMAGNAAVSRRLLAEGQRDSVRAALADPGRRLPAGVQADLEDRLDADFSDVRVHTGPAAHEAAQDVEARAFTTGSRVVFGRGAYDPASAAGKRVLAHELAHVLQQRRGPVHGTGDVLKLSDPSDRFEREADRLAQAATGPVGAGDVAKGGRQQASRPSVPSIGRVVQRHWLGVSHAHYDNLKHGCGRGMVAELHKASLAVGSKPSVKPYFWKTGHPPTKKFLSRFMVQGHLLNMKLGGPGYTMKNLTPITKTCNSRHETNVESKVKQLVNSGKRVIYTVKADYSNHPTGADLMGTRMPFDKKRKKIILFLQKHYAPKMAWRLMCKYTTVTAGGVKIKSWPAIPIRNASK